MHIQAPDGAGLEWPGSAAGQKIGLAHQKAEDLYADLNATDGGRDVDRTDRPLVLSVVPMLECVLVFRSRPHARAVAPNVDSMLLLHAPHAGKDIAWLSFRHPACATAERPANAPRPHHESPPLSPVSGVGEVVLARTCPRLAGC